MLPPIVNNDPGDETLFTLKEAKLELARRECALEGHYFVVMQTIGVDAPTSVVCDRCGQTWGVIRG